MTSKRFTPAFIIILLPLILSSLVASAELIRDVEFAKPDGVSLTLDVNVPDGKGPFPIAILVHGGRTNADKKDFIFPLFPPLTKANFTWFTINYRGRSSNSYPVWVEDVERSIRWVKTNAAKYKGDPKRVALIGESFGSYLVLIAAGRATNETRPDAVVAFYPPFADLTRAIKDGHVSAEVKKDFGIEKDEDAPRILREATTMTYLRPGLPPLLIVHGSADTKAPYAASVTAQERLAAVGVPCELITVTNAPHGMMEWDLFDQSYKTKMVEWLEKTLGSQK